jgi:hypothetical protein
VADGDGGGGGGAGGGEVVAADHRRGAAGVGVEKEDRGLVVADILFVVVGPVAARLHAEHEAGPVEAALEAVKRVGVADRLADDGEVGGVAAGHGGEDGLDGLVGGVEVEQIGAGRLGHDDHRRSSLHTLVHTVCRWAK